MRRLLINFARIGDLVMLTPALRLLGQGADLHLVCRPWGRELLGEQGLLAGIHTLAHPNHDGFSEWLRGKPRDALGRKLGAETWDEIVLFGSERRVIREWLGRWFPGVPQRVLDSPDQGYVPENIGLGLKNAGYDITGYRAIPALTVSPAALAAAQARFAPLGRRVVLVQAGTSSTHKLIRTRPNLRSLAPAQWASLLGRLLAEQQTDAVVLLGSALERRDAAAIAALVPAAQRGRVAVWAGQMQLAELIALSAASQAMISVDTGPAHIAAAVRTPLLSIFGPSIPALWCPRSDGPLELVVGPAPCGPCQNTPRMAACKANICLTRLPEEALMAGWHRLMAKCQP